MISFPSHLIYVLSRVDQLVDLSPSVVTLVHPVLLLRHSLTKLLSVSPQRFTIFLFAFNFEILEDLLDCEDSNENQQACDKN